MRRMEFARKANARRLAVTFGGLVVVLLIGSAAPVAAAPEAVTCLGAENCTANGLSVTGITVTADASDPTCDGPGDTVNVRVSQTVDTTGGSTAYDVGVGIDTSGGAGTACQGEILVAPDTSGSTSDLNSNGGANTCPDLGGSDVATHSAVYTVDCVDDNTDGRLDAIQVFQVWANNAGDNPSCTTTADAFPNSLGTTAKCNSEVTPTPEIIVPVCGDGIVEPPEQCDDSNTAGGDGCSSTCQVENIPTSCGNDTVEPPEQCDDGNNISGDGCSAACVTEFCGDTIVQSGLGETCDDGNTASGDGCSSRCTIEQPVPAVGSWGLPVLMLLLGGAGVLALRRGTGSL